MSGFISPELTQLRHRFMSNPFDWASESNITAGELIASHLFWVVKSASCICQNFPCAPAASASSTLNSTS